MERLEVQLVERQMDVDLQFTSTAGTVCISQSREKEGKLENSFCCIELH